MSVKFLCPQFWGRKWLRQFYGHLEKCVLSAGKAPVHKISRFRGGGVFRVLSGPEKGVITKGVFSLETSLESPKSLDSLESLENGRILLCFSQSGGSLKSLESLNSLESLENGLF